MKQLHLQLALDHCTLEEGRQLAALAAPLVDTVEVGTPFLIRAGVEAIAEVKQAIGDRPTRVFADTKISDEGENIARLCFDAGASAVSVVDGASTRNLREVHAVAREYGMQVWVDLLSHTNPIIRARAISPFVDGFILHRPRHGLPPLLVEGLLAIDHPIRLAGGIDLELARWAASSRQQQAEEDEFMGRMEGIIVGRAITAAGDVEAALQEFSRLCRNNDEES
jgi:3-keto-L-gulonate-6-phosphate decarboxylase